MRTHTRIAVAGSRVELSGDALRPVLQRRGEHPLVALVGAQMLLLGGDELHVEITVGAGARLTVRDIAALVCHPGPPAAQHISITLGDDAVLVWQTEPCVIAEGADVTRTVQIDAAGTARLDLRDTLVLGRSGETGGRVCSDTTLRVAGADVLIERQLLDDTRRLPGLLGRHRVLDSRLLLGGAAPARTDGVLVTSLLDDVGHLVRWVGSDTAASPLRPAPDRPQQSVLPDRNTTDRPCQPAHLR